MAWNIVGWALYGLTVILALTFALGCRVYRSQGQGFQITTATQTLFLWVVAILFLIFDWSKFYLLWALPVSFLSVYILLGIPILSSLVILLVTLFMKIILIGTNKNR